MKKWNEKEEVELIELLKKGFLYKEISKILDRSVRSIKEKTNKLGYKSNSFIKKELKKCLECDKEFEISLRNKREKERKFCSKSCSAKFNNKNRDKKINKKISDSLIKRNKIKCEKIKNKCINCDKEIINKKYCNNKCQNDHYKKEIFNKIEDGDLTLNVKWYKKYLIYLHGEKCMKCDWGEINKFSNSIPIEIEHIDGNSENNNLNNLELLCPNCHSLTPTYKGMNRGNGRYRRMNRYYDGSSY